jgi:hypothetical protein
MRRPERRLTRRPLRRLFAIMTLLLAAGPALACTCRPSSEDEIIAAADVVIVGTVESVRRLPGEAGLLAATIDVARIVKGRVHRQLQVRTRDSWAACGLPMEAGRRVRIAARKHHDGLYTNICQALSPPPQR